MYKRKINSEKNVKRREYIKKKQINKKDKIKIIILLKKSNMTLYIKMDKLIQKIRHFKQRIEEELFIPFYELELFMLIIKFDKRKNKINYL